MSRLQRPAITLGLCLALLLGAGAGRSAADWRDAPLVPKLSGKVRAATLATMNRGQRLGARANVFAKVGDSLSQSAAFAQGLGCGRWKPGAHRKLRRTVRLFAERRLAGASTYCHRVNSYSRDSVATSAGKIAGWALDRPASKVPGCGRRPPLVCEIRTIRPAYAVILFGTNDAAFAAALGVDPLPGFLSGMTQIITAARSRGVVPIVSTIPPRPADPAVESLVERLNEGLVGLAASRGVPLVNLWRAVMPLPSSGIASDGIHLSVFGGPQCIRVCNPNTCAPRCRPANLTRAGLQYGYNERNLLTIASLARLASIRRSAARAADDG
jgi:GDSL-like lipase/acylhydrolase family protein